MARHAPVQRPARRRAVIVAICSVLVGLTWLVFAQTVRHQFVTYDDPQYVYANPEVSAGLSLPRIAWAFTHSIAGNWHPLTTISHMLDCQLYGLNPAGHHFTNVLLHSITAVLLLLALQQMTGNLWRSAFVAAVFAIHPLHVESVAWISERKDVLSAMFFMLILGAYTRYARAPSPKRYLLVFVLFALGLMSKAMLVTVPFVLLLLDYWPLRRIRHIVLGKPADRQPRSSSQSPTMGRLVAEKLPLFVLSAFSSAVTLFTQFQSKSTMTQLPLSWRLNNAVVTYVVYILQMFWPVRLAAFYPHPNDQLNSWQAFAATAFLIAVTLLVIRWRKQRPYMLTGWLWYLGMLVPVIGLIAGGEQARADRYSYLPQIGLYILITWSVADLMTSLTMTTAGKIPVQGPRARAPNPTIGYPVLCIVIPATIIIVLSWRAFVQTSYWKNSEVLWNHALNVTRDNDVAYYNLGYSCLKRGDFDGAISRFETALQIRSRYNSPHYNSGSALIENNLANLLSQKGRVTEAIDRYNDAMRLRPGYGDPYLNLGNILFQQGRLPDAILQWQKAQTTELKDGRFHTLLADAFLKAGLEKDAIAEYEHGVRYSVEDPVPRNSLAWLLATSPDASIRDGDRAVELANEAVRLAHGKDPNYLRTLAAAFAESGRFVEAKQNARVALQAAGLRNNQILLNALRDELSLYELGLPFHR
jgi:protein O-mannosyl-transferase